MNGAGRKAWNHLFDSRWPFAVLFLLIFLLTHIRQNSHTNYNCEICSDKAGYYMYLPAVFQLSFDAADYPAHFDSDHGSGFAFDSTGKVVTKFTCGVAMLQVPFYACGSVIAAMTPAEEDPYSRFFLLFINIGLAFYCTFGLYCMKKWLEFYIEPRAAMLTVLITFFGTHLYYYTADESLMSHSYSFFLLSAALYTMKLWLTGKQLKYFILLVLAVSFAILIRPTNILFAAIVLFVDVTSWKDLKVKLQLLFTFKNSSIAALILLAVFLPQMLYWKFAFGKYFIWSYQGEGFFNWNDPYFRTVWFSPHSGLFPYTPILAISVLLAVVALVKKKPNAALTIIVFFAVSYICAAWSNPWFGMCNFGKRPFVEYLPLLMLPVAWQLHNWKQNKIGVRITIVSLLTICVLFNVVLFLGFDTCYVAEGWDWNAFFAMFANGF